MILEAETFTPPAGDFFRHGSIHIRNSKLEDILALRQTMRREDREEVWAAHRETPEKALVVCYANATFAHTLLRNDTPIAMFGLIQDPDDELKALIYFLGSDEIEKAKKSFMVACRVFVKGMLEIYPTLYNYVDARYLKSVRWLKHLGAEISPPMPKGLDGVMFHELIFRRA